ncbi:MAG TPA: hypothetical protein VKA68_05765 [bacterium]|nr:hypothetical protein [bacterium]
MKNIVEALGATGHWAAISLYDGYNDAQINLGYLSRHNKIVNNRIADKGIAVGAWAPSILTDNTGTQIHANRATQIGVTYSKGKKIISGNKVNNYWAIEARDYKFPGKSNHQAPPGWTGYQQP